MPRFTIPETMVCDRCLQEVQMAVIRFNAIDPDDDRYWCVNCVSLYGGFLKEPELAEPISKQINVLYRHYDRFGTLLYIGITNDPGIRFSQHRQKSSWWLSVIDGGKTIYQRFDTRKNLMIAERDAIRDECPRYNRHHNPEPVT